MEALPVALELSALGVEPCPAACAGDGVLLFVIGAAVVVDDHIRENKKAVAMSRADEIEKLLPGAELGFPARLLVESAEVVIVVRIISHGMAEDIGRLVRRWQPERSKADLAQRGDLFADELPPTKFPVVDLGTIPVECLHHDAYGRSLHISRRERRLYKQTSRRAERFFADLIYFLTDFALAWQILGEETGRRRDIKAGGQSRLVDRPANLSWPSITGRVSRFSFS